MQRERMITVPFALYFPPNPETFVAEQVSWSRSLAGSKALSLVVPCKPSWLFVDGKKMLVGEIGCQHCDCSLILQMQKY